MSINLSKHVLSIQQLQILIHQWKQNFNSNKFSSLFKFRYPLQNILPLPQDLLQNIIYYVGLVMFQDVLMDFNMSLKLLLNSKLKDIYTEQFYHGNWKNNFHFQYTIIYLTKAISQFIADSFINLQNNQNLDSTIFIIIHKVFLGNQIGTKIFTTLSNKYIKVKPVQKQKQHASISFNSKLNDPTVISTKPSAKYLSEASCQQPKQKVARKYQSKRTTFARVNRQVTYSLSNQNFQGFNEQLKKNLYVEPLPVIAPKKIDILQFQRGKSQQTQCQLRNSHQSDRVNSKTNVDKNISNTSNNSKCKRIQVLKNPSIFRNMLSSSMQFALQKSNNQSILNTIKDSSFQMVRQHNSNHYRTMKQFQSKVIKPENKRDNLQKVMTANNFNKKNKVSMDQWKGIIHKLRSHNINSINDKQNSTLHNPFQRNIRNHKSSNKILSEIEDPIKSQKQGQKSVPMYMPSKTQAFSPKLLQKLILPQQKLCVTFRQKSEKRPTKVNLSDYSQAQVPTFGPSLLLVNQNKQNLLQQNKSAKLSRVTKLKLQKINFMHSCKKRQNQIFHSMFNINKQSKIKLISFKR